MVVSAIVHPMETPVFPSRNPIDPGDFANMPFRQPLTYMVVLVVRAPRRPWDAVKTQPVIVGL